MKTNWILLGLAVGLIALPSIGQAQFKQAWDQSVPKQGGDSGQASIEQQKLYREVQQAQKGGNDDTSYTPGTDENGSIKIAKQDEIDSSSEGLPDCPHPRDKGTGVLIEGNIPEQGDDREQKIEEIVKANHLQGRWCKSLKTGNKTWNADGISVDEAMKTFELFKQGGLISLAQPSTGKKRVQWQRANPGQAPSERPGM
ncbi:hypothetical protein K9N68_37465 (plasmid) [Kovacikia minuta CCNUW1]|uniref:hypothetical protein n=1 Tax=Kovacikia minuta TaxID=2931930 RepID=UPI001CCCCCAB|nr:hypothetical protein [Kovacikia minuta]UBF29903.1 hypothetical protein K9N68_37465 [Kovacikia minuta CCNUW1]